MKQTPTLKFVLTVYLRIKSSDTIVVCRSGCTSCGLMRISSLLFTKMSPLNELGVRFNLNEMYLGTFHSICLRWLQDYREFTRLKLNFMMMDQFDQQYFLYQRLRTYEEIDGLEQVVGSSKSARFSPFYEAISPFLPTCMSPPFYAYGPEG